MTPSAARERFARDLAEARRMKAHREAHGVRSDTAMVLTPIDVAETLLGVSGAEQNEGASDPSSEENRAAPLIGAASALAPIPSTVQHPRTAEPWKNWNLDELESFGVEYLDAIAPRTFEYQRGGFDLVDVTVPCIHWLDTLSQVRVTTLEAATARGLCTLCAESYEVHGQMTEGRCPDMGDLCSCGGTREADVHLRAGITFMETQQSQWYWHLHSVAPVAAGAQ